MCGIFCIYGESFPYVTGTLKHRGPDEERVVRYGKCTMEFTRLAINGLGDNGMQPFISRRGQMLMCNGEIYNHRDFGKFESDCACLLPIASEFGMQAMCESVRGVFAICFYDGDAVWAARDPLGVRPLFYTKYGTTSIAFASEAKTLTQFNTKIEIFPPGTLYNSYDDEFVTWWKVPRDIGYDNAYRLPMLFEESVRIRVENTERPIAFLLSGGLDSSLVSAIASKYIGKIKTFSIGAHDSPDVIAAEKVAKHIGSDHTHVHFDFEEGHKVIDQVIKDIESYDTTTVRASVPMWILLKWISENTDCKVILSGEGSDEIFGGYLYFHYAPGIDAFHSETIRRLDLIHQFDGLRADRCAAAHGLEVRVPFLDKLFVEYVVGDMEPNLKKTDIEKHVLRDAFKGLLPDEILWRQKDAFSDAVGYSWVKSLKERYDEEVYYKDIFDKFYPGCSHLITEIWRPRWTDEKDPSATTLKVHKANTL